MTQDELQCRVTSLIMTTLDRELPIAAIDVALVAARMRESPDPAASLKQSMRDFQVRHGERRELRESLERKWMDSVHAERIVGVPMPEERLLELAEQICGAVAI